MPELSSSDFAEFFYELHGRHPFPWQKRLAERVCASDWPRVIDLPTASGKTAAIDIALFAMAACGARAPRRVFFVVDRRLVVNQAFERMKRVSSKLAAAREGVLGRVRERLCELGGTDDPVAVYEMRGGAFRDGNWVKSPEQPMVIASTVDQTGSRLLFRGYGVSPSTWPIHAGLVGNDSLILLDEAHCSGAFSQTLGAVAEYRKEKWRTGGIERPFAFVQMTATPSRDENDVFRIDEADREKLRDRLFVPKPTRLVEEKAKKDDFKPVAKALVAHAEQLVERTGGKRVAIFANRVHTAKQIYDLLTEKYRQSAETLVDLVIGRMRPVDRDAVSEKLKTLGSESDRQDGEPLRFVVSTQCMEVGADLDFDVVASECASIDALQQRFGRLDRTGKFRKAEGAIVVASAQADGKQPDAVYKGALAETWKWLKGESGADVVNMGIEAPEGEPLTVAQRLKDYPGAEVLRKRGPNSPLLLPMHLDLLSQTGPAPFPDVPIDAFLHGDQERASDVYVVWREDLDKDKPKDWKAIVGVCPPCSAEAMAVPIGAFRRWFAGAKNADTEESDIEGASRDAGEVEQIAPRKALIWKGNEQTGAPVEISDEFRPGQTIVLSAAEDGRNELGYVPEGQLTDQGDQTAFAMKRGQFSLRLHPLLVQQWPNALGLDTLKKLVGEDGSESNELESALQEYLGNITEDSWPKPVLRALDELTQPQFEAHPSGLGYVLTARRRGRKSEGDSVTLSDHTAHVIESVRALSKHLPADIRASLEQAARFHDWGKADLRYQAWLRGGDHFAARYARAPIAKSGRRLLPRQTAARLPAGFQHEALSVQFGQKANLDDLALHEIGAHHGECRPFARGVPDDGAEEIEREGIGISAQARKDGAVHLLARGVADRFWRLTRQYGWWGLAYLDAVFRIADWNASEDEGMEGNG